MYLNWFGKNREQEHVQRAADSQESKRQMVNG